MIRHLFGATKKYKTPFSRLYSSRFNLLLDTPIIIRGLEEVVDRYDIFLLGLHSSSQILSLSN